MVSCAIWVSLWGQGFVSAFPLPHLLRLQTRGLTILRSASVLTPPSSRENLPLKFRRSEASLFSSELSNVIVRPLLLLFVSALESTLGSTLDRMSEKGATY